MSTRQQMLAHIVSFAAVRSKAAGLRTTLDTMGDEIRTYLDEHPEEELMDSPTEIRASWKHRQGSTALRLDGLDDAHILYAARNGFLEGNMKAIAAAQRTDPEMVAIDSLIVDLPGTRYLDVSLPSWNRRKELEELAAESAPPSPAATAAANLAAAKRPAATPQQQPPQEQIPTPIHQPAPATAPPAAAAPPVCPDHLRSKQSAKHSGVFCPEKLPDGSWCHWRSA